MYPGMGETIGKRLRTRISILRIIEVSTLNIISTYSVDAMVF